MASGNEIARDPAPREVCTIPVVLYRKSDGTIDALSDRCAHRGFPLSAGTVLDNAITCGYHGFTYDGTGVCIHIPAQERIPKGVAVRPFPLVEKDSWIWIWMGDAEKADESKLPDTHWMSDPSCTPPRWVRTTSSNMASQWKQMVMWSRLIG
ncbi:MAG: Rieske 2Fe-2S domain-containing protein [Actinomycetota bacterium]|nr:Rieske 2Fe-2S domain-containing protein [Actinomycetota bacterium]